MANERKEQMNVLKKSLHRVTAARTAALLLACLTIGAAAEGTAQADYTKIENVYAKLSADGTARGASVVNHFQVSRAGEITDYGAYGGTVNLSTPQPLSAEKEAVRFSAETGNFYYQGNLDSVTLPWNFRITYQLDGQPITPDELGGKSGTLKIRFRCERNPAVPEVFSKNYVMQVSLTLDNDICSNLKAPDATLADAGDGTQLTFTVLPGTDADYGIEADVKNFSMSGFSIAAVPYSVSIDMDSFDTGDFTEQFSQLTDAADQLQSGADALLDGINSLRDGGSSLTDGSGEIQSGLSSLSDNAASIVDASANIAASLSAISTQLGGADSGSGGTAQLAQSLLQLADGLEQIEGGLTRLQQGMESGISAMESASSGLTQEELTALQAACGGSSAAQSAYTKLMTVYQTWNSVKPAFQAVAEALTLSPAAEGQSPSSPTLLDNFSTMIEALRTMSEALSGGGDASGLNQLIDGIAALSAGYADFHSGLQRFASGVETVASNYGDFDSGLQAYTAGIDALSDGADSLASGMGEFADGVRKVPDEMEKSIGDMMDQYSGGDFTPQSFVDSRNTAVSSVQFILSTEGIDSPETVTAEVIVQEQSFWDRVKALFS